MPRVKLFRLSFDSPLGSRERMRARVAATVVAGVVLLLGSAGLLALLNASSEAIGTWSNGKPDPDVRIVASEAEVPTGKACEEQTWPYIEARCLKRADPAVTERSTPKHGLGSREVALPAGPAAPARQQNAGAEPETTGAATPTDEADPVRSAAVPLPVPAPLPAAQVSTGAADPAFNSTTSQQRHDAEQPRLSQREQRRMQREERVRMLRERRQEARRARAERQRARAEARNNARRDREEQRIVRRWTEYTYASPSGRGQRVIVIRRGSLDDDFFRTIR
jgi:hypothetical protein